MTPSKSLCNRIAEEAQLLAEEKWIIEALNKIKKQRNCLQIERLQLESMKAQLRAVEKRSVPESVPNKPPEEINTLNLMQSSAAQNRIEFEQPVVWDQDDCNVEELNLTVSNPVLSTQLSDSMISGEEEEEDEDDEEEVILDINMLMAASKD